MIHETSRTKTISKNKKRERTIKRKIPTSLAAISRESWQAVTRVVVYTVFTRSPVLTSVIDTFIDILKKKNTLSRMYNWSRYAFVILLLFGMYQTAISYKLFLTWYKYLYNKRSYSRILIGSRLWSIRGQTHDWRHYHRVFPSLLESSLTVAWFFWTNHNSLSYTETNEIASFCKDDRLRQMACFS